MSETEKKQRLIASMARSMEAEGFNYATVKKQIEARLSKKITKTKTPQE